MAQIIILSVIILYVLWAGSFLILWLNVMNLAKMTSTLEYAVDYALLKADLYTIAAAKNPEELSEKEKEIKEQMNRIRGKIDKDFDIL